MVVIFNVTPFLYYHKMRWCLSMLPSHINIIYYSVGKVCDRTKNRRMDGMRGQVDRQVVGRHEEERIRGLEPGTFGTA